MQSQPHSAGVKVLLCAFGSLVGLCWRLWFSLSALLLLLFVHSSIITDILKGFPFLSTLSFVCTILELFSLFFSQLMVLEDSKAGGESGAGLKATSATSLVSLPPTGPRGPQGGPSSEGSIWGRSRPFELGILFPVLSGSFGASSPAHPSPLCAKQVTSLLWACRALRNMADADKIGYGAPLLILTHCGTRSVTKNSSSEIHNPSGLGGVFFSCSRLDHGNWLLVMDSRP